MMSFMKEFEHLKVHLNEIERATNNFDNTRVIGKGGFGIVYEGEVTHSKGERSLVALKRLDRTYGQGESEFWKEIMMLTRFKHDNLITLLGFCNDHGERILIYEHASRGSLDRHLDTTSLTWSQRIKICLGAARGITFLHEDKGMHQRVLHRDIKSSNILLDSNWNAKVSDMGLSKLGPANQEHTAFITNVVGTIGYVDPEYLHMGVLTKESDVYSFGVVLVEVFCGRLCFKNDGSISLVPTWKKKHTSKKLDEIIFQDVPQPMDPTSLQTFSDIAFQCLKEYREERPPISLVVEKLELALKFQERHDVKVPEEYEKILESAVGPLFYRSIQGLKALLSKGIFLNEGKMWFSLNDKEQNCVSISIKECFDSNDKEEDYSSRYSPDYNSRFHVGSYTTGGERFKTRVRSQFLSPGITYTMNLVFKCPDLLEQKTGKQQYIAITYELEGEEEKRSSIVYLEDKREDEWLMAGLYQFTTSNNQSNSIVDLQIHFEDHEYINCGLEIQGIEFQPLDNVDELKHEDQVFLDQFQEIMEVAYPPLIYRSIEELKLLLSRGVLLNKGETWFYLNDKGQHCEMISIKKCLVPDENGDYEFVFDYNSRFPVGSLYKWSCEFKTHVRPQFLSPSITYTVNLVFRFIDVHKYSTAKQCQIDLRYKLDGETKTWISYHANKREDNWWMVELCQFTCNESPVDLEIIFKGTREHLVEEGIEFQPLEKVEHEVMEDAQEGMQPISDSDDTYWEQKLPNDHKDIIKWSKDNVQWTTNKELYSILCTGFLIKNGHEWFFLNKNGKRCQMLSAKATFIGERYTTWQSLPESRFGEVLVVKHGRKIRLLNKIKSSLLSPQTKYTSYLVYKLPEDQSSLEGPVQVSDKNLSSDDWKEAEFWYIYLVTPQTPIIVRGNVDENTRSPVDRPKIKGLPQQRSDGWMEVQVHEFQTDTTIGVIPSLKVKSSLYNRLDGLIIQGIELRSV